MTSPAGAGNRPGLRAAVLASCAVVVTMGSLLHFAWEWSGRSPLVAVIAAVNESTWEHLKLALWPALFVGLAQRRVYANPPGWLPATAIRTLLPPVLIVALFYGYTTLLGGHHLALDLGVFVAAVLGGEVAGHSVMWRPARTAVRIVAGAALMAGIMAFSIFSFAPPRFFLFEAP
jgi:hypothetical protein